MRRQTPENDNCPAELVEIEVRTHLDGATVRVRAIRSRAALLSIRCVADDTAFAVLCAERYCAERSLPLLMRPRRAA